MKKVFKTLAVILLVLVVILTAVVVWQWDNIQVLFVSVNYSAETIDTMAQDNEQQLNQLLNDLAEGDVRALSDEEIQKLISGELSEEEAIEIIKDMSGNQPQSHSRIDDIISRMFLLRAEYVNRLTSLENDAKSKAKEIFRKKTSITERLAFIEKYTGKGLGLEKECDARMKSLVGELESEIKKSGKNASIVSEVRQYYETEKKLKKSQLLSKYSKYLK